ncbi:MAG TPA: hypothetical protein VF230_12240 [Acidimicrobiales bacterium]
MSDDLRAALHQAAARGVQRDPTRVLSDAARQADRARLRTRATGAAAVVVLAVVAFAVDRDTRSARVVSDAPATTAPAPTTTEVPTTTTTLPPLGAPKPSGIEGIPVPEIAVRDDHAVSDYCRPEHGCRGEKWHVPDLLDLEVRRWYADLFATSPIRGWEQCGGPGIADAQGYRHAVWYKRTPLPQTLTLSIQFEGGTDHRMAIWIWFAKSTTPLSEDDLPWLPCN